VERICVELPLLGKEGRRAHPRYVLSMLLIDIELARLLSTFRDIRAENGETLFDRTLFLLFGDHGMVDTPNGFPASEPFIEYLNQRLGLSSREGQLGIDDSHLPHRLEYPELHREWQSAEIRRITASADAWANQSLEEFRGLLRENLHESYWWLFFLRTLLIDPRLDRTFQPFSEKATAILRALYLKGDPAYRTAELQANHEFFDRNVRLVYGGGALNNAELFLPACGEEGACTWSRRPSYQEVLDYRGGAIVKGIAERSPFLGTREWESCGSTTGRWKALGEIRRATTNGAEAGALPGPIPSGTTGRCAKIS
jgi:hypothetical protein